MNRFFFGLLPRTIIALCAAFAAHAAAQDNFDGTVKPSETRLHLFDFSPSYAEGSPTAFGQQADDGEEPAPVPPPKRSDGWEFSVAPYLWASSVRADASIGPVSTTSDVDFTDLFSDLEFAGMMRFEGLRNDRWGFYLDGTYIKLGGDSSAKIGPFRLRGIDVDSQITLAWLDFGGMYRFGKQGRSFDLMLGGRYTYMGADVSIGPFDIDESEDVVSPVVGGRVQVDLSDKWLVSVRGDVGGFGIGNSPDLVWGATAMLGYRLSDWATLGFGYRYYDIGVSSSRFDADVQLHGPMVGVAFQF